MITIYFTVFSWIAVKNTGIDKSDLMNVGTFKNMRVKKLPKKINIVIPLISKSTTFAQKGK